MPKSFLLALACVAPFAARAAVPADTTVPVTQQRDSYNWMDRHRAVLERNLRTKPTLIFIGDSITHFWGGLPTDGRANGAESWKRVTEGFEATNLGFGFDYVENALWRVRNGELEGIAPKVAVIMIGTNNLGHKHDEPAACVRGMKTLLADIRAKLPKTKILLLGIMPRGEPALAKKIAETNRLYATLADGKDVVFLDTAPTFGIPDEKAGAPVSNPKLFKERLHPNAAGYDAEEKLIGPVIRKLAAEAS